MNTTNRKPVGRKLKHNIMVRTEKELFDKIDLARKNLIPGIEVGKNVFIRYVLKKYFADLEK